MKKILFVLIFILACEDPLDPAEGCPDINALNFNDKAPEDQDASGCK